MVIVRETQEAKGTTCWSDSSLVVCTLIQIGMTLSDMRDRLPVPSSRSMLCYIDGMD
jgi:hypothetical protein